MHIRVSFVVFILSIFSGCAHSSSTLPAAGNSDASLTVKSTPLVDAQTVDALTLLKGPPALGTPESRADFNTLHKLQRTRTKAECARAETEAEFKSFLNFFEAPVGPLTTDEVRQLRPFFDQLLNDARPVWKRAKDHWARPRPYVTDKTLHPCVTLENTLAYPSGHSAAGELFARVLSDLFPKRSEAIMLRGLQLGDDRLLGGVHHPSDVRDARILADAVYASLKANPTFQKAFADAKAGLTFKP